MGGRAAVERLLGGVSSMCSFKVRSNNSLRLVLTSISVSDGDLTSSHL
jgi:hypothetical protein